MKPIALPLVAASAVAASSAGAQLAPATAPPSAEGAKLFEERIRPALVEHCYECHSQDEKVRGGLDLATLAGTRHGGDSGPAVVPGDPGASLLYTAITWADRDYEMPPKKRLPAGVVADFKTWIEMGAPDPRTVEAEVVHSSIDIDAGRGFWSFQKPVKAGPPAVGDAAWPRGAIDRFVLAELESADLHPSPQADPATLLRRLYFDLVGLPPTPEQVEAYAAAWKRDPEAAYAAEVDALLASDGFGERWGRHWLDVARYAESTGKDVNMQFPHAWRYRDYVVDAFNADKPYDEFLREQIAGDLLPVRDDADWCENLVATGFLAIGTKGLNEQNPRQFALDLADEQVDTTTQALLGLTVSCARCHDHKTDPVPTADYYSLAGIFMSTETYFGTVNVIQNRRGTSLLELPVADADPVVALSADEMARLRERVEELEAEQRALFAEAARARREGTGGNAQQQLLRLRTQLANARARLNSVDDDGVLKTVAMGVQDRARPVEPTVLVRGELDRPGQRVERGVPAVLSESPLEIPAGASGRLELARWIASADNPLTARVYVNRVWANLFGRGLVNSPNNFGATGEPPSHPELLDHLALRFVELGWSTKALVRELVLSASYQQSSRFDRTAYERDPDNTLLWRHSPAKVAAESLRDAMLVASGELDTQRPRGSEIAKAGDGRVGAPNPADARRRFARREAAPPEPLYRSVYLPAARDALPEALALFDAADPNLVVGAREDTNVPGQALYLLNDPFVIDRADAMARRLEGEADSPRAQVARAFAIAYARPPSADESTAAIRFLRDFADADSPSNALSAFCQSLLISAEFRYLN